MSRKIEALNAKYARAERYVAKPTKTREQCIAQIFSVADSWGMARPTVTERTSDAALRKLCSKLDREGDRMGSN